MTTKKTPAKRPVAKITSVEIERLAGKALEDGSSLTANQITKLGASVLRHIRDQKKLSR